MSPDAVMRRWPETIHVFLSFEMVCVGCPVGRIHSLADACRAHGVPLERLLAALAEVTAGLPDRAPPPAGKGGADRGP